MTFTYSVASLTSDLAQVRTLIPDTDSSNALFQDEQIAVFLSLESGVRAATALALETIASNEVLIQKVIRIQDLSTDGAKMSDALLARAKRLRELSTEDEDTEATFAIAEWVVDDFTGRERIWKQGLRS